MSTGLEIITNDQMRAIDARSAELGVPTRTLMENAGRAVADEICARYSRRRIAVLCGPGNNGGDGWVAARVLKQRGWDVRVETLVDRSTLKGDAANAAALFDGQIMSLAGVPHDADLYVDALFGAGLSRPLNHAAGIAALFLATSAKTVVAVDVPSGLHGDGVAADGVHARAALTVTFVRKKPAHVLEPHRTACGDVVVAKIGTPDQALDEQNVALFENDPALWLDAFPWPTIETHKHRRGRVMVLSGPPHATGAARLSARAALRIGAGLVTVLSAPNAMAVNAAHLTAIMLDRVDNEVAFLSSASRASAIVLGPAAGVTDATSNTIRAALTLSAPLVLDADALTVLAPEPKGLRPDDVLTPHEGEFERLFPGLLKASPTRIHAAREAAKRAGCVVLLKGPDTVIAAPDGRAVVNTTSAPFLATAGSGDVLAGFIAGLIGQGMPSWHSATASTWIHGRIGQVLGPGLIAEDLPEAAGVVLNGLAPGHLRKR